MIQDTLSAEAASDPSALSTTIDAVMGQLPGLISGAILAVLVIMLTQRVSKRGARHEAARGLITPAKPILVSLRKAGDQFTTIATASPDDLHIFYKTADFLVVETNEAALDTAIAAGGSLPQRCLDSWKTAQLAIHDLVRRHVEARQLIGLRGGAEKVVEQRATYQTCLNAAIGGITSALAETVPHAASDSRQALNSLNLEGYNGTLRS
jgi:hypothetical protein